MSRRRTPKKRIILPDPLYNSILIHMIVNRLMKNGKKSLAYKIFYQTLLEIKQKTDQDPLQIIEQAISNVTPGVIVKARRMGGSTFQVPLAIDKQVGIGLAIRWLLVACRNRAGKSMVGKLTSEFLDASKNQGNAIRKRDEVLKMAEANKAFAKGKF